MVGLLYVYQDILVCQQNINATPTLIYFQFDSEAIGNRLFELGSQKNCSGKNRATVYNLVKR